MALIKIEPYIIDTTGDFTFNDVTATGNLSSRTANLGNTATANFFIGSGNNLSNIAGSNVVGQVGNALLSGTVYTNAQPNITSVGTLSNLTSNGTINLTGAGNVSLGAVGNVKITGGTNAYVLSTDGSGNLSWVAQSGGGSTSNISNGNSNVNIPAANGNINLTAVGNTVMVITGTGANIAGTLNVTGNATIGNLITSGSGGNITNVNVVIANTFVGSLANGNSNVNIPSANGNINLTAVGNTTLVITGTGANINGTANVTGNLIGGGELNITGNGLFGGNLTVNGTLTYINSTKLSISDPIINLQTGPNGAAPVANTGKDVGTALNYYDTSAKIAWMGWDVSNAEIAFGSNVSIASEVVTFTSLANIRSGNASLGNAVTSNFFIGAGNNLSNISGSNVTGQVGNALISGTVYTNAQPNITSVGTLSNLTSTGTINLTGASNVSLGAVGNVKITGGTNAYVLSTDGSGNLSWVAQSGGGGGGSSISNGNSNVNIPAANGNINFTAVGNIIAVISGTGVNVAGTLNTTGNVTLSGANVSLGAVGNVKITGGTNTYLLSTDGTGNLSWAAPPTSASVTVDNFTGNGVQTVFTLSTTPTGINQTSVNYNGATVLRTDYSLAGANITFSSAPANGSLIEVTTINLTSGGGGGGTSSAAAVGYSLIFGG